MPFSRLSKSVFTAIAISTAGLAIAMPGHAQSPALFTTHNAESTTVVDTSPYAEIISALSVEERGRTLVAYEVAHANALPFFSQYVDYLANVPVSELNRDEQLAYWLNTRNVLLLQAISEEQRVRGFIKRRGTPSSPGDFWTQKRITVAGTPLSLHDIEQDILFAGWDEPNIMFGLYQGIRGGPALPRAPFTAAKVHEQLAKAGSAFTSETRNFRARGNTVRISSYFDWYLPLAYAGSEATMRTHLASFAEPSQQALVSAEGKLKRRNLSTEFEQFRPRQGYDASGASGSRSGGGFGS